jgi:hypothetical protein
MSLAEFKTEAAGGEVPPTKPIAMPHNCLDGFNLGADLDLRVRFAMELLKSPIFGGAISDGSNEKGVAISALDIADHLFAVAQMRGLIKEISGDHVDEHIKAHVRRQVDFDLYRQSEGQRQSEACVKLASAVASTLRKR